MTFVKSDRRWVLPLLLVAALLPGSCGDSGGSGSDGSETSEPPPLTEEEVTAAYTERAERNAMQVSDDDTNVEVVDSNCVIIDPQAGEARCTETVKFQSLDVLSVRSTDTSLHRVTYNTETGAILTVK
jgi:hypothetical protein